MTAPEERIAYVVTSGSYSDYHIVAVFDNEAAAQEYAGDPGRDEWGDGMRVERFTLNSTAPVASQYWEVSISHPPQPQWDREVERTTVDLVAARDGTRGWLAMGGSVFRARGVHADRDTARKIAQDNLTQLMYANQTLGLTELP